jgi:prepilin-type N-terminal cleavage/methylation domain-containing protein
MVWFFSNRGFTLIEMIMTILIGGIIALMVGPLLQHGFHSFFAASIATDMDDQARMAMERMSREIREITTPASDVTNMSSNRITFVRNGESITYRMAIGSPTTLIRRINLGNQDPLATGVSHLSFSYLQKDLATPATGAATLWVVDVQFTLSYNIAGQSAGRTFRNRIFLRNAV